jgi:benzoylformate decarboxylase
MAITMTGIDAFLEILAGAGVRYLFGNPGTTELPLNDALAHDRRFQYFMGLHEVAVMGMADGYALASRSLGVVNVHIGCGLGNAMGMLYNAYSEGTPLLLTAGQQDRRLRLGEPVLNADLVSVARPWTKWAYEVSRVEDLPLVTRRAVQTALTPPTGPVFLALPVDVQTEACAGLDLSPPIVPDAGVRPPRDALVKAAALLADARNPVILAGSRVTDAGAVAELVAVAELWGAPVFSENASGHGRLPFPPAHPLYGGPVPLWSPDLLRRLEAFDVALVVGTNVMRLYIYQEPANPLPAHLKLVQFDNDPAQIARTHSIDIGLIGDPKAGLTELKDQLQKAMTARQVDAARVRREQYAQQHQAARKELKARIDAERESRPMTPLTLMGALARVLPPDIAVVEEATTTTNTVLERLGAIADPMGYFGHRGWALGMAMGSALGIKLAWPERPVLAVVGDGAAMFGIQGLWSAAHHRIPVTYVVACNREYKILKNCGKMMPLPEMAAGHFVGMDLTEPTVDYVGIARSLGVEAERVNEPDAVSDRVRDSFRAGRPLLLEVPLAG